MVRYAHTLSSGSLIEVEEAIFRYESAGWKLIKLLPEDQTVLPTSILFEWPYDSAPHYPMF